MKSQAYLTTYLCTLIAGIVLLVLNNRQDLFSGIAIVLGVVFLAIGVLSFIQSMAIFRHNKQTGGTAPVGLVVASVASVILGLLMIIVPSFFVDLLVYAIAIMLILCGTMQLYNFVPGIKSRTGGFWLLATPILSIIAGVVIICLGADKVNNFLAILAGIVLVVYSINGFVGYFGKSPVPSSVQESNEIAKKD